MSTLYFLFFLLLCECILRSLNLPVSCFILSSLLIFSPPFSSLVYLILCFCFLSFSFLFGDRYIHLVLLLAGCFSLFPVLCILICCSRYRFLAESKYTSNGGNTKRKRYCGDRSKLSIHIWYRSEILNNTNG